MSVLLFAFPDQEALTESMLSRWPAERGVLIWHRFPDSESLITLDGDCEKRDVVFLASCFHPDELALPLLFASRTARELGARRVGLIAPYLAYMRQDQRFHPGEAVSSIHFARFLSETFDWLVTVDPHLHRHPSLDTIFAIPTHAVSAMPLVAQWIREHVPNPVLIGPDSESAQWVKQVAALVNAPLVVLNKLRHGDRDVEVSLPDLQTMAGRTPVLIDDIVSSGQTLLQTAGHLRQLGSLPAICVVVHGIFADHSDDALLAAGVERLVSCNTLNHSSNAIDVSELLVSAACELADRPQPTLCPAHPHHVLLRDR